MGLSLRKIKDFASRAYDQVNPFDNNRTWEQRTPTQSKSNFQQLGQIGGQTVRQSVRANARVANTVIAQAPQIESTIRMMMASRTNNPIAFRNAQAKADWANNQFNRGYGGIMNVGTLYSSDEAKRGDFKTGITRIGAGTADAMLEAATLGYGAPVGKSVLAKGVVNGIRNEGKNLAKTAGLNFAQGTTSAKVDGASWGDAFKAGALNATAGTAADVGLGVAGAAYNSGRGMAVRGINNQIPEVHAYYDPNYSTKRKTVNAAKKIVDGEVVPPKVEVPQPDVPAVGIVEPPVVPTHKAYGREIQMTEKNGYRAIATADGGVVYQKVAKTGSNAKGTQLSNTFYGADGTKLTKAQAEGMVSGQLKSLEQPKPKVAIVEPPKQPKVALKQKAEELIAKTDAKAKKARRNTTVAEEIKIAKALEEAGIDPATVQAPVKNKAPYEKNPYQVDVSMRDPSKWERMWKSTNAIISRYGEVGAEVARKIKATREFAEVKKADFYNAIPNVKALNKEQMVEFADTLDTISRGKKPKNVSPEVAASVQEWQGVITRVLDDARAAGIDMGDLGDTYFPRFYKDLDSPKFVERLMKEAADKGKPITRAEANSRVNFIREADVKKYGHLEKSRVGDFGGYEKSHEAIANYVQGAYDRIARAKEFGAKDEFLDAAKGKLQEQGYDVYDTPNRKSVFSKYVDIARSDTDRSTASWKASNKVRQVNAVTSLSAAGISNAGQLTNTGAVAGIGRTIKAGAKVIGNKIFGSDARTISDKAGVALDGQIKAITEATQGTTNKITRNIASPFFAAIEKFNRETTAIAGADFGNHLAKKAAGGNKKALETLVNKFGVTGKIGAELTEKQQVQMARKMVEISQFKVDPMDMPGWVETPLGKLAMQFRSFGYKQTGFIWNEILKEARKGNFAPLARFTAVGVPVGLAGGAVKDAVKFKGFGKEKEEDDRSLADKAPGMVASGLDNVGAFGLPGNAAQSIFRGAEYDDVTGSLITTVGGPTAGLIKETTQNLSKAENGNTDPLARMAIRKIPAVGPTLANIASAPGMPLESTYKQPAKAPKAGEEASPAYKKEQAKKEKEALDARENTDGYSLQQLSDGKYAYTLDGDSSTKTASSLKDAREAIAKDTFEKSGEKSKVVGDRHYFIDQYGEAKSEYKFKYEFDKTDAKNKLEMDIAKDAEDYGAWNEIATRQLKSLEKLRDNFNKEGQEDEVDKTQLKIENLKQSMRKYAGYGGSFTKGRKGRGGGGGIGNASKYRVSVSSRAISAPKVSIKSAGSYKSTAASKGGGGKPKVSMKKSLV